MVSGEFCLLDPPLARALVQLTDFGSSLIALSLIMSLLQFKPAPMYILDEIDAALDLQHTQHIGQLFKNRFKGSQFIVVSLKEGLFTNANVLFKARFRDGTSIVEVSYTPLMKRVVRKLMTFSVPSVVQQVLCTRARTARMRRKQEEARRRVARPEVVPHLLSDEPSRTC